jgi:hypothetical protein
MAPDNKTGQSENEAHGKNFQDLPVVEANLKGGCRHISK